MDSRNIKIVSSIFEARYEPKVSARDQMGIFQDQFKDFKLNEIDPIRIQIGNSNQTKTKFLSIENIGVTNIPYQGSDTFIKECKEITQFASNQMNISHLNRIGIRLEMVIPLKDNEMGNETLNFFLKLFGKNAVNQLGQTMGGFNLEIGTNDNENKFKFSFQFARREDNNSKIFKDVPKQGLIIDADYSRENVPLSDATEFIDNSINLITSKTRNFLGNFLIRSEK